MQSDYTSSEDLNVDQKMLQCENAAMDAGGCDRQTSTQAKLSCDFMDAYHEVAPICDTITNTGDKENCLKQTKTKQIDLLEKAALDAGLTAEAFLVPGSLPRPGAKDSEKMQSKYTFFNINIFKLGPVPVSKEPVFLLGDAAHAPNFLSGCGVVGGQDDSAAVGHYSRWLLKAGNEEDEQTAKQCTADMLKVVQNLVFERSCKYSDCHEHTEKSFVPEVPGHTIQMDPRYEGKTTNFIAQRLTDECVPP